MINIMQKTPKIIFECLKNELYSIEIIDKFRVTKKDFTRVRKQTFSNTLLFMMNFLRKSLSLEIENFVKHVSSLKGVNLFDSFTKSAFGQCRNKINPLVFVYLNQTLTREFYTDNDDSIKLWKGFRLLAVDGSRLTLPSTEELKNYYGETKNQINTGVVQARVSVLYDVLNKYVLDGILSPLSNGEVVSAIKHLEHTKAKDLIIYDRGYPSFRLIYEHFSRSLDFVIRAKKDFNNEVIDFYASGLESKIIKIYPGKNTKITDKSYGYKTFETVRLIKVTLSNGEDEILITSLLDTEKYPSVIFKSLYFKRWSIETFYDEFKTKLKVENFSGYSKQSILQDFYAALFVSNIQTMLVEEINEELRNESKTKYVYKVNNNLSYGILKDRIVTLFFSNTETDQILSELKQLLRKHIIPIRPDRKFERYKDKYRNRQRLKVTKNQKDTI